ncbi:MAG: dethiobiotin synthase [Verrucomicrobiota bacterium]
MNKYASCKSKGFFITGTDTEVGKTWFTAALVRYLRHKKIPALGLKPIVCGERTDAQILAKANEESLPLNDINPIWLEPPLAPFSACVVEGRPFDFQQLHATVQKVMQQESGPFLIEGVGGWLVPINETYFVRDWAKELSLPIVLVARASLGTINHTLLSIESIQHSGCDIRGIILNHHQCSEDLSTQTNPKVIEQLTSIPVFEVYSHTELTQIPDWLIP